LKKNPVKGAAAYICTYAVWASILLPCMLLTLGSGFAYTQATGNLALGVLIGTLVSWVGLFAAANMATWIARNLLRDFARKGCLKKSVKLQTYDKVISGEKNSLKIVFLLRMSPIMPFNLLNYFLGMTGVSYKHNAIAVLGMIPNTLVFVYLGGTLESIADLKDHGELYHNWMHIVLMILGLIIAVLCMVWISRMARKEIEKMEKAQKEKKEDQKSSD
jgi:uncharacterized membrane protein YdjX (TVP38/TMEM64 family)